MARRWESFTQFFYLETAYKTACVYMTRFPLPPPRRGEPFGSPYFIFKIRLHFIGCRSFFAKSHARLTCSFVNALSGGSLSLPTFCEKMQNSKIVTFVHKNRLQLQTVCLCVSNVDTPESDFCFILRGFLLLKPWSCLTELDSNKYYLVQFIDV